MKAVLISINPEWVEKIINGEMTILPLKRAPKLETPVKYYIYCTKQGKMFFHGGIGTKQVLFRNPDTNKIKFDYDFELMCCENVTENNFLSGKIVAEFTCHTVIDFYSNIAFEANGKPAFYMPSGSLKKATCMTNEEMVKYGKGKTLNGLHISDLKVYDTPKELSEFRYACRDDHACNLCKYLAVASWDKGNTSCGAFVRRPPQAWCYVEEI